METFKYYLINYRMMSYHDIIITHHRMTSPPPGEISPDSDYGGKGYIVVDGGGLRYQGGDVMPGEGRCCEGDVMLGRVVRQLGRAQ